MSPCLTKLTGEWTKEGESGVAKDNKSVVAEELQQEGEGQGRLWRVDFVEWIVNVTKWQRDGTLVG